MHRLPVSILLLAVMIFLIVNIISSTLILAQTNSTPFDPNVTSSTTSSDPNTTAEMTTSSSSQEPTSSTSSTSTSTTTVTTLPTNSTTTTTTSTMTSTTTTTTTQPTRGASAAPVQRTPLPHGQLRIEPASPLVRAEDIRVLADQYLRQQKSFILPVGDLPQNWNFSTNITDIQDGGWSIILSFFVLDLDNPNSIRNNFDHLLNGGAGGPATVFPTTTSANRTNSPSPMSGGGRTTTNSPSSSDIASKLVYIEQRLSAALAQTLSDACNSRYYQPGSLAATLIRVTPAEESIPNQNGMTNRPPTPATSSYPFPWWPPTTTTPVLNLGGRIAACTGREFLLGQENVQAYATGEWNKLESIPIPRAARDPTNSASSASNVIPDWAVALGCLAAAMLGWAIGMLFAFAFCPKLPHISLKDRLLSDEDELEQDLGEICLEKMRNSVLCCCVGNGPQEQDEDEQDGGVVSVGQFGFGGGGNSTMKKVNSATSDDGEMKELDAKLSTSSSSPSNNNNKNMNNNRFVSSPIRAERNQFEMNQMLNLNSTNNNYNNNKRNRGGYARHEEL